MMMFWFIRRTSRKYNIKKIAFGSGIGGNSFHANIKMACIDEQSELFNEPFRCIKTKTVSTKDY